ncbi:MAG: DUF6959 family protein [Sphingorhabdus sp.]
MRINEVEIYSDTTNAAVMRHPGRRFPGTLVQGDSLSALCHFADGVCRAVGRGQPGFDEANELRNMLQGYLAHYINVLDEHSIPLPFSK